MTLGFDPTRFQTEPPACYRASWQLPGPDFHRQATTSLRPEITYTVHLQFCWAHERSGLTPSQLAGLFGKLQVLERMVARDAGAVAFWTGPTRTAQDFHRGGDALEVKTTTAPEGRTIHVHGIDQLDVAPPGRLLLFWARVRTDRGASVPDLVDEILALTDDPPTFLKLLGEESYQDTDREIYGRRLFDAPASRGSPPPGSSATRPWPVSDPWSISSTSTARRPRRRVSTSTWSTSSWGTGDDAALVVPAVSPDRRHRLERAGTTRNVGARQPRGLPQPDRFTGGSSAYMVVSNSP